VCESKTSWFDAQEVFHLSQELDHNIDVFPSSGLSQGKTTVNFISKRRSFAQEHHFRHFPRCPTFRARNAFEVRWCSSCAHADWRSFDRSLNIIPSLIFGASISDL
jgi:hypothetical protein